ncbi:uncharacterized protein CTHT_0024350 [Thermochaetoides thermophila DSM 1495]|uniref:NADH-ubiquinone oxidoreductase B15 subunit n=1 Tax=Chaetomium thermophilum (strain DSM 1495 / CBS 144.50 / IMI 039719) TaxID=759272 RepID=G0S5C8_CHATD|nr:hypothetical protein CTHT_0024350 [Thermochaetoides thermophila DSM 1495]7ZM7_j Chain j, Subunit NDUFB4 of NADH-ubiquinone oxidoreductase (Complex I) [Thermochaetoides thermophila DSM 1495]7ZM8_j Chain j, Subunit NDUFB4 of NADH-ubiquinone oxidoreductase (Complex I) [Thermochaetoides thermophila DSM 1495]7ZMB_j Chain j, Subunit NDUFB4 of NADH-ubiquinone oxidoreductase (Complex I) [Thermochaetoides thermophila DSM 1495]7ZME_j Chain j, Subunit NDUFB4 of NADH-ubiquinone oxidoreductase (Complex I
MAGLQHYKIAMDPALVRLGSMISNRYKYFRWTKRTALVSFMYVVVVPSTIGYLAYKTDGLWDLRAKRRGDLISER